MFSSVLQYQISFGDRVWYGKVLLSNKKLSSRIVWVFDWYCEIYIYREREKLGLKIKNKKNCFKRKEEKQTCCALVKSLWEKASCNEKESVVWHKKSFILFNHFLAVDLLFENSTDTLLKVIHNSLHSWNLHQFLHEMLLSANNTTYKIQP